MNSPHGGVAAVCVWPQFVSVARHILEHSFVRTATVINFPSGQATTDRVMDDIGEALDDGANEIDLVFPYLRFLEGEKLHAREMLENARDIMRNGEILKVILETSAFSQERTLQEAAQLAIDCGADFLKTSTGKRPIGATLPATEILLKIIKEAPRDVGLKISGGLRTLDDVLPYMTLIDKMMGLDWMTPRSFRIGSSQLYNALLPS